MTNPLNIPDELYQNGGNPRALYRHVDVAAIPVLDAYDDGFNYKVWCAFCRVWHLHGRVNGHRVEHCYWPLSPYMKTGYFIRKVGDWKDRPKGLHNRRRSPRQIEKAARMAREIAGGCPHCGTGLMELRDTGRCSWCGCIFFNGDVVAVEGCPFGINALSGAK